MTYDPLSAALDLGKSIVNKVWPDPIRQAEETRKLQELYQKGDIAQLNAHVQLMLGQLEVNKAEAKSGSVFVAGWRPFIGWVGGSAMAYQFVVYPLLLWCWSIAQAADWIPRTVTPPPILETGALFSVVTAMLGVGAMRSYDKGKGSDTRKIG